MKKAIRVAVTGGAGQISYSALFRIGNGDLFGKDQPVELSILELPISMDALKGVVMELEDCAFPLLKEIHISSEPKEAFADADVVLFIGAKPRGPGQERKDLLAENGKIFVGQGKALNEVAKRDAKMLVVGNPCNTNALVLMHNAPNLPRENFFAMTRLDQNRAQAQLAAKAGVDSNQVENLVIWGNHSATQVPDFLNAKISGKPVLDVITDRDWLEGEFFTTVQQRGAAIIKARGKSSAASAASAAVDTVNSIFSHELYSAGVISDGNPYGIADGLIFSLPLLAKSGSWEIVKGFTHDDFLEKKIKETEKELMEERDMVASLLR